MSEETLTPRLGWRKPYGGTEEGEHPEIVYAMAPEGFWGVYPEDDGTWTVKTRTPGTYGDDPNAWTYTRGFLSNTGAKIWCEEQVSEPNLLGEEIANLHNTDDYPWNHYTGERHPRWRFELQDFLAERGRADAEVLAEQIAAWSTDFERAAAVGAADSAGGSEWRSSLQRFLALTEDQRNDWLANSDDYRLVQCHVYGSVW